MTSLKLEITINCNFFFTLWPHIIKSFQLRLLIHVHLLNYLENGCILNGIMYNQSVIISIFSIGIFKKNCISNTVKLLFYPKQTFIAQRSSFMLRGLNRILAYIMGINFVTEVSPKILLENKQMRQCLICSKGIEL